MHQHHNRKINLKKDDLITKIKKNKEKHIQEFNEACEDYKREAQKQIDEAIKGLSEGKFDIKIQLITPVDRSEEYDKVISMFDWELSSAVELTQGEFNEYVHDETQEAQMAFMSNTKYKSILR